MCETALARWPSLPPLRDPSSAFPIDLYLQHRSRKRLVNPFSLRPLICSYLLQHPKKSRGIFPSLLPIDSALRKSALLSKHYWSPCSPRQLLHQCIKGLDELKFHFRQLVPFIFYFFFWPRSKSVAHRGSIAPWRLKVEVSRSELRYWGSLLYVEDCHEVWIWSKRGVICFLCTKTSVWPIMCLCV